MQGTQPNWEEVNARDEATQLFWATMDCMRSSKSEENENIKGLDKEEALIKRSSAFCVI